MNLFKRKKSDIPGYIHGTTEGRLYIDEVAFFSDHSVKEQIRKLLNSKTYKSIRKAGQ